MNIDFNIHALEPSTTDLTTSCVRFVFPCSLMYLPYSRSGQGILCRSGPGAGDEMGKQAKSGGRKTPPREIIENMQQVGPWDLPLSYTFSAPLN